MRLFPIYLLVLIATICLEAHHLTERTHNTDPLAVWAAHYSGMALGTKLWLIGSNLALFGQDGLMFTGFSAQTGALHFTPNFRIEAIPGYQFLFVPQAWTLGVELLFYLMAPVLVRSKLPVLLGVAAASFALRAWLFHHGLKFDPWTYRFFPAELGFFLVGSTGYRAYRHISDNKLFKPIYGACALAVTLTALVAYQWSGGGKATALYFLIVAAAIPLIFLYTKRNAIDRFIGDLSYPVYISQFLVFGILGHFTSVTGIHAAIATIAFSVLILITVDHPVDRIRQRFVARHGATADPGPLTEARIEAEAEPIAAP
jgi:peptidoglycan/LPS O-acetylase OafA/YrhL